MRRQLTLLILLLCASSAQATIRYVSFSTGSNANDGLAKTVGGGHGPWKSVPGMRTVAGCGGATPAVTLAAGDQVIFEGGDTWPAACFQWVISNSGLSGSPIYFGVDLTWFIGGSFARPIFDMANTSTGVGAAIQARAKFIIFDNIELKRLQVVSPATGSCNEANMDLGTSSSGNITVKNMFIHDWTIAAQVAGSTSHFTGSICQSGASGPISVDTVEMSDAGTTATVPFGACFRNMGEVKNSSCHDTCEGEVGFFGPQHDNQFFNINGVACQAFDSANHTNIIETSATSQGDPPIYNNLIHDTHDGVTIFVCPQTDIYNNVMWNNSNASIMYVPDCPGASASSTGHVYNNTVDCSNGNNCFKTFWRTGGTNIASTFFVQNNHWISNSSPNPVCVNQSGTCNLITASSVISNNLTMPTATATTQGYTVASKYRAAGSTVNAGLNLSANCPSLIALCFDIEGNPAIGGSYVPRAPGSTTNPWDDGAYNSPFSGGGSPPTCTVTAPTSGAALVGNATITATSSGGTLSSIQLKIDGGNFNPAGTSSPYSQTWDTTTAANGSHTIGAVCTSSTGSTSAALIPVTVNNPTIGCTTSGTAWSNLTFATQTQPFSVTFTIKPNGTPAAGTGGRVVAFSQNAAAAYTDNAALIRQSDDGNWEVWDNTAPAGYRALAVVPWLVSRADSFLASFNLATQTYSVQVMVSGVTTTLATNFKFRAAATSLSFVNLDPATPPVTLQLCAFTLGPQLTITPNPLNFPAQNVSTTSAPLAVTITNSGGSAETLQTPYFTLGGANPGDFANSGGSAANGGTIAQGASVTSFFTCTPSAVGARSATLTINGTASGTITLNCTGQSVTIPVVSLVPGVLHFNTVNTGTSSATQPVTLKNVGTATLNITSITSSDPTQFPISSNLCGASLAPNTSCTFNEDFAPTGAGPSSASVSIVTNASSSPNTVAMDGLGFTPVINPPPAPAPAILISSFPAPDVITLTVTNCAVICKIQVTCVDQCKWNSKFVASLLQ